MKRIAIVGFGGAGYCAAKAAREYDPEAVIDVYSDTDVGPYNPMLTTYFVKGDITYDNMFPFGTLGDIADHLKLNVYPETPVKRLNAARKSLEFNDGSEASYDAILLSTGASAVVPPIPGIDLPGVFKMRTYRDALELKEMLSSGKIRSGLVIGASWVGIKIVEDLYEMGIPCTLVDGADRIFPVASFDETSRKIEDDLAASGIKLSFGQMLSCIEREEDGRLTAVMQSGKRFTADTVAVCIGVRPNSVLAREAGIAVNRGVLVDEKMQTSAPGIYAAGDCCEAPEVQSGECRNIGVWMNAKRQGAVAGANLVGGSKENANNILLNLAHYMGRDFVSIGDIRTCGPDDDVYEYDSPDMYIRAVKGDGKIRCINLLSMVERSGIIKHALLRAFGGGLSGLNVRASCLLSEKGIPNDFITFVGGTIID